MNGISEEYVRLVLAMGQHDPDYVDAFYGPEQWKAEAAAAGKVPLTEIREKAGALISKLGSMPLPASPIELGRQKYLRRQLSALSSRADILTGGRLTFDEESRALYDATSPQLSQAHFDKLTADIDAALPGDGSLIQRYENFKRDFIIPPAKLDEVFQTAIRACRERTLAHIALPADESFTVEYVKGKSWSGYNWYQGNYRSLIQVNTDLPIYIDRAIDLACHEGYPGHHVYNVLLEKNLVRDRGWQEFSIYPLFSPQSLIAEGSANYGIDVAFPANERLEYEREILFPLAGIDPQRAEEYYRVQKLVDQLSYAGNEAARRYLNGEITAAAAADWLERYAMMPRARAEQRVRFFDQYRSYVINYNLGKDLVRKAVESRLGGPDPVKARWREFEKLLSSPTLPSDLAVTTNR